MVWSLQVANPPLRAMAKRGRAVRGTSHTAGNGRRSGRVAVYNPCFWGQATLGQLRFNSYTQAVMVKRRQSKRINPMRQMTLATGTFETYRKPTRRERFLADMEKVVPWQDLCAVIAP